MAYNNPIKDRAKGIISGIGGFFNNITQPRATNNTFPSQQIQQNISDARWATPKTQQTIIPTNQVVRESTPAYTGPTDIYGTSQGTNGMMSNAFPVNSVNYLKSNTGTKNTGTNSSSSSSYSRSTAVPGSIASITTPVVVPPPSVDGRGFTGIVDPDAERREQANLILEDINQELDPETLYQQRLAMFQDEINATNAAYADILGQAKVTGQGRLGSQTALQARRGLLGSDIGQSMTNVQQDANLQEQKAIQNEKTMKVQNILGVVRKSAFDQAEANRIAKSQGAEAIIKNLSEKEIKRKENLKSAVNALVADGIRFEDLDETEKKSFLSGLSISEDAFKEVYAQAQGEANTAKAAGEKSAADLSKTQAETDKIRNDIANWGKMTDYQKAQLEQDASQFGLTYELNKAKQTDYMGSTKPEYGNESLPISEKLNKNLESKIEGENGDGSITTSYLIKVQEALNNGYTLKQFAKETGMPADVYSLLQAEIETK